MYETSVTEAFTASQVSSRIHQIRAGFNLTGLFIGDIMKQIKLTKGKVALVDNEDYERIVCHKWFARFSANRWGVYRWGTRGQNRKMVAMARFILNTPRNLVVDHINNNVFDNRKNNLRACTQKQNTANRSKVKGGTSKYKGVSYNKKLNKWQAESKKDHKHYYIGIFDSEEKAARAYDKKAKELFGDFAWLNFKDELRGKIAEAMTNLGKEG